MILGVHTLFAKFIYGWDAYMKFIVLVGKDNTGKTTTLKKVIDELIAKGAKIVNDPAFNKFGSCVTSASQLPVSAQNEITILLEYKNKRIGITTYGDTEDVLNTKIDLFIRVGCTHIICGSHPDGSNVYTYLENTARKNNVKLTEVTKIGCKGDKADSKYDKVCDYADRLAADEIILHI